MSTNEREIIEQARHLDDESKRLLIKILQAELQGISINAKGRIILSKGEPPVVGVPGKSLLDLAGSIPMDDLERMEKALEDTEQVDPNGW